MWLKVCKKQKQIFLGTPKAPARILASVSAKKFLSSAKIPCFLASKLPRKLFLLLISIFFLLFSITILADDSTLKIHFLDAGEGDSILIEAPKGGTALIDAGNSITGFNVLNYLRKNNISKLDYLIFTHLHLDHIGGSFFIAQEMEVKNIYDNGQNLDSIAKLQDIYRWYVKLIRQRDNYASLEAGDALSVDKVSLEVLWPDKSFSSYDFNINSLVIMIKYKNFRCLLMGDATIEVEEELLKRSINLKAQVLKVSHHGDKDSSSLGFLRAVSPRIAVISVNKDNIRRYPSEEALERLKNIGSQIYRTDQDGNIIVLVDEEGKIVIKKEH